MRKLLTIAATILAVITVALTTYGGEALLSGTTAHAATINVEQPLEKTATKTTTKAIVKDDLKDVIQSTTAESEKFTIEADEVLEAKEKLEAMMKQNGRTGKVAMKTVPAHSASADH